MLLTEKDWRTWRMKLRTVLKFTYSITPWSNASAFIRYLVVHNTHLSATSFWCQLRLYFFILLIMSQPGSNTSWRFYIISFAFPNIAHLLFVLFIFKCNLVLVHRSILFYNNSKKYKDSNIGDTQWWKEVQTRAPLF